MPESAVEHQSCGWEETRPSVQAHSAEGRTQGGVAGIVVVVVGPHMYMLYYPLRAPTCG